MVGGYAEHYLRLEDHRRRSPYMHVAGGILFAWLHNVRAEKGAASSAENYGVGAWLVRKGVCIAVGPDPLEACADHGCCTWEG